MQLQFGLQNGLDKMTTKLISANLGITLQIERDGKQEKVQFSCVCPSPHNLQPYDMLYNLCKFINETFDTELKVDYAQYRNHFVEIAKPKKIKAHRPISQKQFNKRIKELVP